MGTTVTALMLSGDRMAALNVGDSRCYLVRDGELTQLTRDDTYVQALVDQGVLTPDDARRHPQRALVTQAVQGGPFRPAGRMIPVQAGDRFLLCSDGLSDYVEDSMILQTLLANADRKTAAAELVHRTLENGAPDNVTVIVADVVEDGESQQHPIVDGAAAVRETASCTRSPRTTRTCRCSSTRARSSRTRRRYTRTVR